MSDNYIVIKGGIEAGKTYIGYSCSVEVRNENPEEALRLFQEYLAKTRNYLAEKAGRLQD